MNRLSQQAFNHYHPRKPIKYWEATDKVTGICLGQNNSIAILRAKWGGFVNYKAVR